MDAASRQATRLDAVTGRFDAWLIGFIVALVSLGIVMVGSSSVAQAETPTYILTRHLMFLGVGTIAALWAMRLELKTVERLAHWLLPLSLLLLVLVLIPGIGVSVKGARRWINLGVAGFQVVEAVKVFFIVWMASYLKRFSEDVSATWPAMLKPLGVAVLFMGLLLVQPDFGSATLLMAIAGCMLVLGGAHLPRMFGPAMLLLLGVVALAFAAPYRVRRLTSFMNPFEDAFGAGFQLSNALMAIGRGEWFGVGLGASVHKLPGYLPEAHNDFIFSVIAEELGFVGVCLVVALYVGLVGRALWLGLQCIEMRRHFAGYCAFGIALWIGLQSTVSMGVNLGLLPTKGLTLPLVSYGGSSVAMTMAAMGLLLRISYELERARRQVARLRGEPSPAVAPPPVGLRPTAVSKPATASAARPASPGTSRLRPRVEPTFGRNIA
jgi:cell division protein FtsW